MVLNASCNTFRSQDHAEAGLFGLLCTVVQAKVYIIDCSTADIVVYIVGCADYEFP